MASPSIALLGLDIAGFSSSLGNDVELHRLRHGLAYAFLSCNRRKRLRTVGHPQLLGDELRVGFDLAEVPVSDIEDLLLDLLPMLERLRIPVRAALSAGPLEERRFRGDSRYLAGPSIFAMERLLSRCQPGEVALEKLAFSRAAWHAPRGTQYATVVSLEPGLAVALPPPPAATIGSALTLPVVAFGYGNSLQSPTDNDLFAIFENFIDWAEQTFDRFLTRSTSGSGRRLISVAPRGLLIALGGRGGFAEARELLEAARASPFPGLRGALVVDRCWRVPTSEIPANFEGPAPVLAARFCAGVGSLSLALNEAAQAAWSAGEQAILVTESIKGKREESFDARVWSNYFAAARAASPERAVSPALSAPEVRELLATLVRSALRYYHDGRYGGFVSSWAPERARGWRGELGSKRLEDNSLICWALLAASPVLPERLARSAASVALETLRLLDTRLAAGKGLAVAANRDWSRVSGDVHSEDIAVYCIASFEAYRLSGDPTYKDRSFSLLGFIKNFFWDEEIGAFRWSAEWDSALQTFTHFSSRIAWSNVFAVLAYARAFDCSTAAEGRQKGECERIVRRILDHLMVGGTGSPERTAGRLGSVRGHTLFANALYLLALTEAYRISGDRRFTKGIGGGSEEIATWLVEQEDTAQGGLRNADPTFGSVGHPVKNGLSMAAAVVALNEWVGPARRQRAEVCELIDRCTRLFQLALVDSRGLAVRHASEAWEPTDATRILAAQAWAIMMFTSLISPSD